MADARPESRPGPADEPVLADMIEEVTDRLNAGSAIDAAEYVARYPQYAAEIDQLLGVIRVFGEPGPPPAGAGGADGSGLPDGWGFLGDFRILREVGRGGMGVVYEAEQVSLRRRVALKVLPFAAVMDPRGLQRFKNEALAAAALDHPHAVKVYGVGQDRGVHFIALQFVDGRTVADLIRDRRDGAEPPLPPAGPDDPIQIPDGPAAATAPAARASTVRTPADGAHVRRVAEWAAQAADALEHAHALGIVHRDVKPGNLLIDGRGHLYVADFGLAQVASDPGLTATGALLGTPRYMSPEQAEARHNLVDHRTDVYSLGATLYELLTLEPAVRGATRQEVLSNIAAADPIPPRAHDRRVPAELETIALKCLAKDPAGRYQSAKELADDLRSWLAGRPIRARPVGLARRAWRSVLRRPLLCGLSALTVTAILSVPAVASWYSLRLESTEDAHRQAELKAAQDAEREKVERAAWEFSVTLKQVQGRRAERPPGWAAANLADLRRLAATPLAAEHRADLATEAAAALGAVELGEARVIAPGFKAYAPAYRPDGQVIALGAWLPLPGGVCQVKLVNVGTGDVRQTLTYPSDRDWERLYGKADTDGCRSLVFSPDGRWLVVGTRSGRLVRWDLTESNPKAIVWRHAPLSEQARHQYVSGVAFTPSGRTLASAGGREAVVWDTTVDWGEVFRDRHPTSYAVLVRQARPEDPVRFATSDNDGFLVLDRPPWASEFPTRHGVAGQTPGGVGVVVNRGNGLEVLYGITSTTVAGGEFRLPNDDRAEDGVIGDVLVHPSGEWVVTSAEHRGRLRMWSVTPGRLEATRVLEEGSLRMAFSPDGSALAVTTESGTLLYDLRPSRVTSSAAVGPIPLHDADVSADGRTITANSTNENLLVRWQTTRPSLPDKFDMRPDVLPVKAIASSADSRWIIFTTSGWMAGQQVTRSQHSRAFDMPGFETTRELRVGPDDRAWAIGAYGLRTFKLAEWLGPEKVNPVVDELPATPGANLTCVHPGAREAWVGRDDGQVSRYGGPSRSQPTATHRVFPAAVTAVARSGDGRLVLAGARSGAVRLIDAATGQVRVDLPRAHDDEVGTVAFLPDGGFVTGSRDRTVKLWDPAGRLVLTLPQTQRVRRVFVSADGATLTVLAEGERGLRQWHLSRLRAELAALGLDARLPQ